MNKRRVLLIKNLVKSFVTHHASSSLLAKFILINNFRIFIQKESFYEDFIRKINNLSFEDNTYKNLMFFIRVKISDLIDQGILESITLRKYY